MASKSNGAKRARPKKIETPARRGRPPGEPRTHGARWVRARGWTVRKTVEEMQKQAPRIGLPPESVPQIKALASALNGRHCPSPCTILLMRHVTNGDVDLEHWVRDLYT